VNTTSLALALLYEDSDFRRLSVKGFNQRSRSWSPVHTAVVLRPAVLNRRMRAQAAHRSSTNPASYAQKQALLSLPTPRFTTPTPGRSFDVGKDGTDTELSAPATASRVPLGGRPSESGLTTGSRRDRSPSPSPSFPELRKCMLKPMRSSAAEDFGGKACKPSRGGPLAMSSALSRFKRDGPPDG